MWGCEALHNLAWAGVKEKSFLHVSSLNIIFNYRAPVVQKLDNAIHWINLKSLDNAILISVILIRWIVLSSIKIEQLRPGISHNTMEKPGIDFTTGVQSYVNWRSGNSA